MEQLDQYKDCCCRYGNVCKLGAQDQGNTFSGQDYFKFDFVFFVNSGPTCSPVLLPTQATSSTSVRVTWKPPPDNECRNGILKGYRLRYKLLGREISKNITISNANATTYDATGLLKYRRYIFSVLAYTVENGPWSNELTNRTGEDGK